MLMLRISVFLICQSYSYRQAINVNREDKWTQVAIVLLYTIQRNI